VITNVAAGHLEGFGSLDGVRAEKLALARGVPVAVVGAGDPALAAWARAAAGRAVTAGFEPDADVRPDQVAMVEGHARLTIDGRVVTLAVLGRHQGRNAILAWAVSRELGLDPDRVASALGAVRIPGGRGELVSLGDLLVLNDCYNANPASFRAAIELADSIRSGRRLVFVAGSMLELGPESAARHAEIAERLVALRPELLAGVGEFGPALEPHRAALDDRLLVAPDAATMGPMLATRLRGGELLVLKGSRGVALERMLPLLTSRTVHPD
jgi:UDP-N-acetylmuramoyl-tripeptide--D-alanyl-D-alanine ligase